MKWDSARKVRRICKAFEPLKGPRGGPPQPQSKAHSIKSQNEKVSVARTDDFAALNDDEERYLSMPPLPLAKLTARRTQVTFTDSSRNENNDTRNCYRSIKTKGSKSVFRTQDECGMKDIKDLRVDAETKTKLLREVTKRDWSPGLSFCNSSWFVHLLCPGYYEIQVDQRKEDLDLLVEEHSELVACRRLNMHLDEEVGYAQRMKPLISTKFTLCFPTDLTGSLSCRKGTRNKCRIEMESYLWLGL